MAWTHHRAVNCRVLKRLRVGRGAIIPDGLRRLSVHGNSPHQQPASEARAGNAQVAESSAAPPRDKRPEVFLGKAASNCIRAGAAAARGLRGVSPPRAAFVHTKSVAGAAEPTVRASHLDPLETMHVAAEEDVLQLENGAVLFSGMESTELLTTLFNLGLVSFEPMVDLSVKVLTSPLMKSRLLAAPVFWAVKKTAYSHFCAGEDADEAAVTLNRMWQVGLKGILDYSLEDAENNQACDQNCAGFLSTIHHTRSLPQGSVSFACVKISAICPISLLERVSDLLRWQHKSADFRLPWKADGLPILSAESPTYQTRKEPEALGLEEERDLLRGQERLSQLCEACAARNLPILVDAEYSSIQPAIDYMTYAAAFAFNRPGTPPIVYNTLQAYLKDAPSRLALALAESSRRNASLALKIVRGAYITREKALAASVQAPSPIHNRIQDTHSCYNSCASIMLDRIASNEPAALMLATHNADSGRFAAKKVIELGLDKKDPRVQFAQLKGMSDSLSLALARGGFNVSKYLPFGPVAHVIPYLLRRAEENRGLLGNTKADRRRVRVEILRRLASAAGLKEASPDNSRST
ncbi:proline dehydrogenase [Marchantia polymorpha subsp. ruderalis]